MAYKVGPPNDSVQLVYKYYNVWVDDTQITIVHGVYKPTNITGGPHLVDMHKGLSTSHPLNQITIIGEMGAS